MSKSILITGCSDNGLGSALAIAFHDAGYRVIASARNLSKVKQVTAAGCETFQLDVTSSKAVLEKKASELGKILCGKLDILLNNAGQMCALPISDLDVEVVRAHFELNVFSLITMTQAFLPLLRAAPEGWIVNNTSTAAVLALPISSAYSASKAAASRITQALRLEMMPFGIKVVELRTSTVTSSIFANGHVELPSDSIYALVRDKMNAVMRGVGFGDNGTPADKWAKQVVSDLSGKPPIFVYRGNGTTFIRIIEWLPHWMLDGMLCQMVGLDILGKELPLQKKQD